MMQPPCRVVSEDITPGRGGDPSAGPRGILDEPRTAPSGLPGGGSAAHPGPRRQWLPGGGMTANRRPDAIATSTVTDAAFRLTLSHVTGRAPLDTIASTAARQAVGRVPAPPGTPFGPAPQAGANAPAPEPSIAASWDR